MTDVSAVNDSRDVSQYNATSGSSEAQWNADLKQSGQAFYPATMKGLYELYLQSRQDNLPEYTYIQVPVDRSDRVLRDNMHAIYSHKDYKSPLGVKLEFASNAPIISSVSPIKDGDRIIGGSQTFKTNDDHPIVFDSGTYYMGSPGDQYRVTSGHVEVKQKDEKNWHRISLIYPANSNAKAITSDVSPIHDQKNSPCKGTPCVTVAIHRDAVPTALSAVADSLFDSMTEYRSAPWYTSSFELRSSKPIHTSTNGRTPEDYALAYDALCSGYFIVKPGDTVSKPWHDLYKKETFVHMAPGLANWEEASGADYIPSLEHHGSLLRGY